MIAIVTIISTSIMLYNYHFFLVVGIKFYSLSKFDNCNTILLSIFTILYVRSLILIYY